MRMWWMTFPLVAACNRAPTTTTTTTTTQPLPITISPTTEESEGVATTRDDVRTTEALAMTLSEGTTRADAVQRPPVVDATPLRGQPLEQLLERLPLLQAELGDLTNFQKREDSLPLPQAGTTTELPFPPPLDQPVPEVGETELTVLHATPEGEVPITPRLSVTFSQPMVAVGTVDETNQARPVNLSPEPPGQWRWIGTRTVLFEPEGDQLPKATDYTISVAAGTTDATGDILAEPFSQVFSTPPAQMVSSSPQGDTVQLEPIITLLFDQAIDSAAIADHISVSASGTVIPWRYATAEEVAAERGAVNPKEAALGDRLLHLRPEAALPQDARVLVAVEAGAPSAEGPRVTTTEQTFSFETYGPFKITDQECGYQKRCRPADTLSIELSNPVSIDDFSAAQVEISPEIPNASIWTAYDRVYIEGVKTPRTSYTVTLPETLTDTFGQTIEGGRKLSFRTTALEPPEPYLSRFAQEMLVFHEHSEPVIPLETTALSVVDLQIFRVQAEDWSHWQRWKYKVMGYEDSGPVEPPGERVHREQLRLSPEDGVYPTITPIQLAPHLADKPGHLVVWVQPVRQPVDPWEQQHAMSWIQSTNIGLVASVDAEQVLTWATDLMTGAPLQQADISLVGATDSVAQTDTSGLATLPLSSDQHAAVIARKGEDSAILPGDMSGWQYSDNGERHAWFVFDDRQVYRPGETVSVKGWIRMLGFSKGGSVRLPALSGRQLSWQLEDSVGNLIASGSESVSTQGGFHMTLDLPDTVNLGYANLSMTLNGPNGQESYDRFSIQIQEFRRPEFETVVSAEAGPYFLGEMRQATATGRYYAGGVLPGAPVSWTVSTATSQYTPPNQEGFHFGTWTPWWRTWDIWGSSSAYAPPQTFEARTDGAGQHVLNMHFRAMATPKPIRVEVSAAITDINRQTWSASDGFLVHPAAAYVGIQSDKPYYHKGEEVRIDLIAVDVDGAPLQGLPLTLSAVRSTWERQEDGAMEKTEAERHSCDLTAAAAAVTCAFTPEEGGTFEIVAETTDAKGRPNQTTQTLWVTGGQPAPGKTLEALEVTMVPDKDSYAPGDTAELLVLSPVVPGHALVTWRRHGVINAVEQPITEASTVITVPITAEHLPNLHINVEIVGGSPDPDAPGPAQATGSITLPVSTLERTLSISLLPDAETLMPGTQTPLTVRVTDASGAPVEGAEVAIVAVDESVLALTGYQIGDPISLFYPERPADTQDYRLRSTVWVADDPRQNKDATLRSGLGGEGYGRGDGGSPGGPQALGYMAEEAEVMMDMAAAPLAAAPSPPPPGGGSTAPQIALRTNFNPLAMFAPAVTTDSDGAAALTLALPDNLTRYRLTAVAVSGDNLFGRTEANVTAQLPLMVRPSPPRFLNFGDRFELPLIVQNQGGEPLDIEVAVRATNALFAEEGQDAPQSTAGRTLTVPAGDRVEVRFPAMTDSAGTARFQFAVSAGDFADAAEVSLPVWTPATSEAFATYGQVDATGEMVAIQQPIAVPQDVWPQFGGLEVTTSTTAVGALTDAVIYLFDYPYGCSEQISSRILAIAALRDVLDAFDAEGLPPKETLEAAVAADIEMLGRRQNGNGGFGFWKRGDTEWPFISLHVTHALVRAKEKGFEVPEEMIGPALRYLQRIESQVPSRYDPDSRYALEAYALYIRHLVGDTDAQAATRLMRRLDMAGPSLETLGWLLPILKESGQDNAVEQILTLLTNRTTETAAAAHFVTRYGESDYLVLHSSRRTDGVLLDALIRTQPDDPLIPKLVEGLLGSRVRGRWSSTQDNAFILLAMDNYFNTYEGVEPDLVARAWIDERYLGERAFEGRTTEKANITAPMGYLQEAGGETVTLANDGAGRLYYRIGMRYAPRDLNLEARDAGFTVERTYSAVDAEEDVQKDADGTWRIRAGARVRVRLTMVADGRRSHVALVDPLPAGLEVLNPDLAITEDIPPAATSEADDVMLRRGWWWGPWYSHENLRDERAEAFAPILYGGVYSYSYVTRATTPGTFVVPPAKAEEMYHPETFGRTATATVVVYDP